MATQTRRCLHCGNTFHGRKEAKFCNRACFDAFRTTRAEVACSNCGRPVVKQQKEIEKWNAHFCSMKCYSEWKAKEAKGGWSLESRKKASASRKALLGPCGDNSYERYLGKRVHRSAAEKMAGRPLRPGEVVHHINGDKHDNRPENLMIFSSQQEHAAYHAKHPEILAAGRG